MFDHRRAFEGVRHEPAPLLPVGAAVEILGVILHRLPGQEQPIARRFLHRTMQRHRLAALGALEIRRGLGGAGLEFGFEARLYVDLCDFEKHGAVLKWCRYHAPLARASSRQIFPRRRRREVMTVETTPTIEPLGAMFGELQA